MANFQNMLDRARAAVQEIPGYQELRDKVTDAAGDVRERTKYAAKMTKLTVETNGELENLQKTYAEIGKLYYEQYRDYADAFLAQLCDEVTQANARIAQKERELDELRAAMRTRGVEVEFEEVPPDRDDD